MCFCALVLLSHAAVDGNTGQATLYLFADGKHLVDSGEQRPELRGSDSTHYVYNPERDVVHRCHSSVSNRLACVRLYAQG